MSMLRENDDMVAKLEAAILFEDTDVLIINKPSGVLVHNTGSDHDSYTVADWLAERELAVYDVGESQRDPRTGALLRRGGVVHRLDKETSGVLVLVKNQAAYDHCKRQFHDRLTEKEYRAIVYGTLSRPFGTIDRPIGRSAKDWRRRSAEPGAKGTLRDAVTHWEAVGHGSYHGETFSYVKLIPKTGRTHQLRVHLKAIDRPIVCDELYAGTRVDTSNNLNLQRLALHAHSLTLQLPSGESRRFVAPLPLDLTKAVDHIAEG